MTPLPVAPATFSANVELWLAVAVIGTFGALVAGFLVHRRETRRQAAILVGEPPVAPVDRTRLSA